MVRDALVADGRPPGGRRATVVVAGTDLSAMLVHVWTARSLGAGVRPWPEWLAAEVRRPGVAGPDRPPCAGRFVGTDRSARAGCTWCSTTSAGCGGWPAAGAGSPRRARLSADAVELARRTAPVVGTLVTPERRTALMRHRLRPVLAAQPGPQLRIPRRYRPWLAEHTADLRRRLVAGDYAVHGDSARACRTARGDGAGRGAGARVGHAGAARTPDRHALGRTAGGAARRRGGEVTRKVLLHVGTPKTGTSYLQHVLFHNRRQLRHHGITYPADRLRRPLPGGARPDADALGRPRGAGDRLLGPPRRRGTPLRTATPIISHEILATASRAQIGRALESLGHGRGTEIHLVLSVRDLVRQIPAEWQENVKHRAALSYGNFLNQIQDPRREGRIPTWFWGVQEIPDILDRWGHDLPPEHVHVVTVPPGRWLTRPAVEAVRRGVRPRRHRPPARRRADEPVARRRPRPP